MKINLVQSIKYNTSFIYMEKEFKSVFIPRSGDFITDPAFDKNHKVGPVILDLNNQSCRIILEGIEFNANYNDAIKLVEEKYGPHNWNRTTQ